MIWAEYLLLLGCTTSGALVLSRLAGRERPGLGIAVSIVPASVFVLGLAWLQGGRLTGDFFAYGLWGRGTLLLGVVWLVGLMQVYGWMVRAGLPVVAQTLIAVLGMAALAWARGNRPAMIAGLTLSGLMLVLLAGRRRRAVRFRGTAWTSVGMLIGGVAMIAESGAEPHVPFSAWIVVLSLPLADAAQAWIRGLWRRISVLEEPEGLSFHQRLMRLGWTPSATDRLYVSVGGGLLLLALGHFALRWYGVHVLLLALAGLMAGLEVGVCWLERRRLPIRGRSQNTAGLYWVMAPLLLFAFSTRAVNLLHQGFLSWDEAHFAFLARDFLTTHDVGWTGVRPIYILLLAGTYAAFGLHDSIGGYVSLTFGLLSISLAFAWARQAFGREAALVAAAALTASALHGWYSRWQNSMAVTIAFMALAGYAHVRSTHKPRPWAALLLAGASLGMAMVSHYVIVLVVPVWLLFEGVASRRWTLPLRTQRLAVLVAGLAITFGVWVLLMPPGSGPISNLLHHSKMPIGCCLLDDLRERILEKTPTPTHAPPTGDVWYYWRTLLAFEGWLGSSLIAAATLWMLVRVGRGRDWSRAHVLFTLLVPLVAFSVVAARGGDAQARPLSVLIPNLAILVGAAAQEVWRGARGYISAPLLRTIGVACSAVLLLGGAVRAQPLRSLTTPYRAVREWLLANGMRNLVVLNPAGDDNGFAWKFYFGQAAHFADTEEGVAGLCAAVRPEFMLTAGESLGGLMNHARLVARFDNPIPMVEQLARSPAIGLGLRAPIRAAGLFVYDVRGCAP